MVAVNMKGPLLQIKPQKPPAVQMKQTVHMAMAIMTQRQTVVRMVNAARKVKIVVTAVKMANAPRKVIKVATAAKNPDN